MNRDQWAHEFFTQIGVPDNHRKKAARACISHMQTEGGSALWNPLNCVMKMPGSTNYQNQEPFVQSYPSFAVGMEAATKTILQNCCGFPMIVKRYRDPRASSYKICRSIADSEWGTGPLIFDVLEDIVQRGLYWDYASHQIAGS